MISKTDLRKQLLEKRKNLNTKELSSLICKKIIRHKAYKSSKNIFAYYPKSFEVDITPLFEDESKKWFLPKVYGENLYFFEYKMGDDLAEGKFGIKEPINSEKTNIIPDLIIVPALAIDKKYYRLGYGKGFYDRYLRDFKENCPTTITPIFSDLIVEALPADNFDKKIDIVITE